MGVPVQIPDYSIFNHPPTMIGFFEGSDLQAWLNACAVQDDEIEQVFMDILTQCNLGTAQGAQLDLLGVILGLARNGLDDAGYQVMLFLQAAINQISGTPESIIDAMTTILGLSTVTYIPLWPAVPAAFALLGSSALEPAVDYALNDNLGDAIVDNLGDQIVVGSFFGINPTTVAELVPSGVTAYFGDLLYDNSGDQMVDNNGNSLMIIW